MQLTDSFYAINYIIPFDSQIFIAGASKNKDNITNQQNNIPYIEPTNYIFSIDEGEHSLVYETQEFIKSVAINNKNYFFADNKQNLFKLNLNRNIQKILLNDIKFETIIYITEDNNTIYYLYDKEIHKFNIIKNIDTVIYKDKREKCKINNAMILSFRD